MKVAHGITIHCQDDENNLRINRSLIKLVCTYYDCYKYGPKLP